MGNRRGKKRMYATNAEKQSAYRARNEEANLIRRMRVELGEVAEIAEALGKIQNIEYIVAAIPVPKLLAQSIRERERSANIPVADQVRTFFLAGCEVILRTLDLAVERASGGGKPISEDDQSKLVNRLAGEVANFAQEQVKAEEDKGEEGARN